MKKSILFLALMPFALTACLEDEGNYDYTELDTVEISGLAESMRCVLLQKQNITPNVVTSIPESRLEYIWRVGADTLANTKTLDYTFTDVPINNDPLTFEVLDKETNVRYSKAINLTVVSPFTTGYAILTEGGKLAFQSFESGNPLYNDICQEVGADALSGTPKAVKQLRWQDGNSGAWYDRISVTMQGVKSPEFDGVSMKQTKFYEDEFHTSSVPQFSYISSQYFNADKAIDIITDKGQVYVKMIGSMGSPDAGYFEYPLVSTSDSYRLAPILTRVTSNDPYYITLDEQNHCFVTWMGNNLSARIAPLNFAAPEHKNIPGTLLWIGNPLYTSDTYAIVKNNGKYYLYVINYELSYTTWNMEATMKSAVELPDGAINDNCVFAANIVMSGYSVTTNYLFVGDGPKLKAINLLNLNDINSAVIDVATFDGDITDMHFDRDVNVLPDAEFSIAVSRSNGSSIYQIDPTIINHGAVIRKFDGIQGRIVSFCRKI